MSVAASAREALGSGPGGCPTLASPLLSPNGPQRCGVLVAGASPATPHTAAAAAPCSASPFSPRLDPTLEPFSSEYGSHAAGSSAPPASAGSLAASELLAAPAVNVVPMTSLAPGSEVLTQLAGLHPVLWAELVQAATLLRPAPALGGGCTASGRPEPASSMPRMGSAAALALADLRPLALSSPDSDSATSLAAAPGVGSPGAAAAAAGSGLLNYANSVAAPAAAATAVGSSRTAFAATSAPAPTVSTDPDQTGGDGAGGDGGRSCLSARWDDALEAATAAFSRSLSWSWDPPPPPPSPPPSPPPASPKAEVPEALLPLGPYGGGGLVAGRTAACWASAYQLEVPPGGPLAMRTTAVLAPAARASGGGSSSGRRRGLHEGTVRGGLPRGAAPDGGLPVARGPWLASSW